jgi:hypothetical protein
MRTLGKKLSEMASLIMVKDPLISAWLAIMAAAVATIIPGTRNHPGIMA